MLRTNPVAHETSATVRCRLRIHVPRRIPFQTAYFSLENQSTMYSTSGNQPLVSNAVTTRNASKKRKLIEIDDVNSHSETLHPNTQPIGEADKLTHFRFLPRISTWTKRFTIIVFIPSLNYLSSTRQTTLLLSKSTLAPSLWSCINHHASQASVHQIDPRFDSLCLYTSKTNPQTVPPIRTQSFSQTRTYPLRYLRTVPNIKGPDEATSHLP